MEEKIKKEQDAKPEKLSYEQLENIASQLSEQNRQLYSQIQAANLNNMFKRLDYLFEVLSHEKLFPQDFTEKCINEVIELLTIPEKQENESKEIE
jgi:hypothetical protein